MIFLAIGLFCRFIYIDDSPNLNK